MRLRKLIIKEIKLWVSLSFLLPSTPLLLKILSRLKLYGLRNISYFVVVSVVLVVNGFVGS
jgi:hypothetical protein